jgi:hypothetical protein
MLAGKILGRSMSQQQAETIVKYSEDPQDAAAVNQVSQIPASSSVAGIAIFVLTALAAALVITIVVHYRGTILEQSFF